MAKSGMSRPSTKKANNIPKNTVEPVPEIQGKAKTGNDKVKPTLYA